MYFNVGRVLTNSLVFILFNTGIARAAQDVVADTTLTAQPKSCITLHQGRNCFAKVTIRWESRDVGDYCLFQAQKMLHCWQNSEGNKMSFTFESNENITFYLVKSTNNKVIAETTITVGWVHEATPRKRRWRLF